MAMLFAILTSNHIFVVGTKPLPFVALGHQVALLVVAAITGIWAFRIRHDCKRIHKTLGDGHGLTIMNDGLCTNCGYLLHGTDYEICPECGTRTTKP